MSSASPIDATLQVPETHHEVESMDVQWLSSHICHACTIRVFGEIGDGDSGPRLEINPALPSSSSSAAEDTLLRVTYMEVRKLTPAYTREWRPLPCIHTHRCMIISVTSAVLFAHALKTRCSPPSPSLNLTPDTLQHVFRSIPRQVPTSLLLFQAATSSSAKKRRTMFKAGSTSCPLICHTLWSHRLRVSDC